MLNKILFFSILIFIINIFFIPKKTRDKSFKNVDKLNINFSKYFYKNISNILNKKFYNNIYYNDGSGVNSKKIIRLYFINFVPSYYQKPLIKQTMNAISSKFHIVIDKENPDYLIYNIFGCSYLKKKYKKAIKIAFYTENQIPDFNIADYAIGMAHINYLDRYFKRPYFVSIREKYNEKIFKKIRNKVINSSIREKFCAAVISNKKNADFFRLKFVKELNKYKQLDYGGKVYNNVGYVKDKIKFLTSYKFSIAMENTEGDGYLSEKIIQSFLAGTIPIYYGDYMLDEYINLKAIILIRGEKDMKEKIEYIKKIDNDYDLYKNLLKENVFVDGYFKEKLEKERIDFLVHIFEQDKNKAKRIDYERYYY